MLAVAARYRGAVCLPAHRGGGRALDLQPHGALRRRGLVAPRRARGRGLAQPLERRASRGAAAVPVPAARPRRHAPSVARCGRPRLAGHGRGADPGASQAGAEGRSWTAMRRGHCPLPLPLAFKIPLRLLSTTGAQGRAERARIRPPPQRALQAGPHGRQARPLGDLDQHRLGLGQLRRRGARAAQAADAQVRGRQRVHHRRRQDVDAAGQAPGIQGG